MLPLCHKRAEFQHTLSAATYIRPMRYIAPMPNSAPSDARRWVALFDLDGTLSWRDTFLPFLLGYTLRRPARWVRLLGLPAALLQYGLFAPDRGRLKSQVIRLLMSGETRPEVEAWADRYVAQLKQQRSFRAAALAVVEQHRAAGDHLVLLSASPDLYVPRIGRLLGFERTLCTEIKWRGSAAGSASDQLDGALMTENRRGEEKSRCLAWLRTQYAGLPVIAYGNSASDLPHLRQADRGVLVNANSAARRAAAESGITVEDWA